MDLHLIEPEANKPFLANPDQRNKLVGAFMAFEFVMKVTAYGLGLHIFEIGSDIDMYDNNEQALNFRVFIILGTWNAVFGLLACLKYPFDGKKFYVNDIFFAVQLVADLFCEVAFYKDLSYFSHAFNGFILARAIIVILYVVAEHINLLISCYTVYTEYAKYIMVHVCCCILFALASGSMLVLNIIILDKIIAK